MDKIFVIAEAGVNHNGDLNLARRLIDAACHAGADAVKFQTFRTENVVTRAASKAEYQAQTTGADESQFEMIKRLELSYDDFTELAVYCAQRGIEFLSTPFDLESVDFLVSLGVRRMKIPSGEINNTPYLRKIGALGKEIILSTGMARLGEVEYALDTLEAAGTPRSKVTVLQCTTEYPAPLNEVNLRAMLSIQNAFGVEIGYSDHTVGIEISIAAAALGARVIEKHFTLDKNLPGPDHTASLEPHEFAAMVHAVRNVEAALGDGRKTPSVSEERNVAVARRSIVAAKAIWKGDLLTAKNLTVKRPGIGIPPHRWDEVVGTVALRDYVEDELI